MPTEPPRSKTDEPSQLNLENQALVSDDPIVLVMIQIQHLLETADSIKQDMLRIINHKEAARLHSQRLQFTKVKQAKKQQSITFYEAKVQLLDIYAEITFDFFSKLNEDTIPREVFSEYLEIMTNITEVNREINEEEHSETNAGPVVDLLMKTMQHIADWNHHQERTNHPGAIK